MYYRYYINVQLEEVSDVSLTLSFNEQISYVGRPGHAADFFKGMLRAYAI